ncbi:hypothetical protein [Butyrivibrio sp. YAB3001]|uniref:hypothetical protein n=1 Tax=Butyrivibrio sp. YAB3001 TaxID=1520812 RepID=UPI0008F645FB|nr:hypothetical protein [Butyrivibrio sp. YAB3001]SFB66445.1 hypothetical protein SAMN02910398_00002 [Butyrivibrio sp. YAB3001]
MKRINEQEREYIIKALTEILNADSVDDEEKIRTMKKLVIVVEDEGFAKPIVMDKSERKDLFQETICIDNEYKKTETYSYPRGALYNPFLDVVETVGYTIFDVIDVIDEGISSFLDVISCLI